MDTQAKIHDLVHNNHLVLFMKGTPNFPQCGFTGKVVACLQAVGAQFVSVNVLEDDEIREGIKVFGDWPTIPQLYLNGELVGGCDIVVDLYESGELAKLVA